MGYMHIDNLYKNVEILLFKECYALEKIHGTSAHIQLKDNKIIFFSGGEKHNKFVNIFDKEKIKSIFIELFGNANIIVFGEAYGGKQQGMSITYGAELKFVVFDVKIDGSWLCVPDADDVAKKLGLEFVDYVKINTDMPDIDFERDKPSIQANRNGIKKPMIREGIVLRPIIEVTKNNGSRIISKHKRDEFLETKTKREIGPERLKIIEDAKEIANEWVTPMRLNHVLDKLGNPREIRKTGDVIKSMIEDIIREAEGEIKKSKQAMQFIGKRTASLYKNKIGLIQYGQKI